MKNEQNITDIKRLTETPRPENFRKFISRYIIMNDRIFAFDLSMFLVGTKSNLIVMIEFGKRMNYNIVFLIKAHRRNTLRVESQIYLTSFNITCPKLHTMAENCF